MPNFPKEWFGLQLKEFEERKEQILSFYDGMPEDRPFGRYFPRDNMEYFGTDFHWIGSIVAFSPKMLHLGVRTGFENLGLTNIIQDYFKQNNLDFEEYDRVMRLGASDEIKTKNDNFSSLSLFVAAPGRVDKIHIDSTRSSAINFPVDVNHEESYFHIASEIGYERFTKADLPDSAMYPSWRDYAHDGKDKGWLDESLITDDMMTRYDLKQPILFDSKTPHGGVNNAETHRVIFSISYHKRKHEIRPHLPENWFA
jgi:hypothetical protein